MNHCLLTWFWNQTLVYSKPIKSFRCQNSAKPIQQLYFVINYTSGDLYTKDFEKKVTYHFSLPTYKIQSLDCSFGSKSVITVSSFTNFPIYDFNIKKKK